MVDVDMNWGEFNQKGLSQPYYLDMTEFLNNPEVLKPLTKTRKENIDLESLSKEELIERVKSLEMHVQQLRNVIARKDKSALPSARVKQKERKFDFSRYKRRHVLLQV